MAGKGCGDKGKEGIVTAKIGDEVSVKVGQILRLKDGDTQGFRFSSVENDNRCPIGMNCLQAGAATILIEEAEGSPRQINVAAKGSRASTFFDIKGARVKVLALDPYPDANAERPAPEDYVLRLELRPGAPSL